MSTTRKSLFFSFLDRYASLIISIITSMVIARLLTPTEIGLFSVTMVLLVLATTVRDMGTGQYLIQEKNLTIERIRAVWAVQLGLGVGLACIVLLASNPAAILYEEPRMRDIMLVVAFNYAINPFGSLTYAWLMREMHFDRVALMRFFCNLGGAVVSIWLAYNNYGPISLAWGSLTSTIINALIAVYFRPKFFPWLPGVREIKRVLGFGSQLTTSSIITSISGGAPEFFIGTLQNLTAAGFYSRASGLVQMFHRLFVDAVAAVCLPWFAKQSREQGNFIDSFLKSTAYVTAFGWSFCLILICLAHPIVRVLYGDQWDQSVDLVRLLAVAMVFSVPAALCHIALLAAGVISTITRVTLLGAIQSIVFVVIGAFQDILVLGIAIILASSVNMILWMKATFRHIHLPFHKFLATLRKSALVASIAAIAPIFIFWLYGPYPDELFMPLFMGGVGCLMGFLISIFFFQHPLQIEIKLILSKIKEQIA